MALPTTNLVAQYIASAGVTLVGGKVSQWNDQTGTAHAVQGTAGDRPTPKTVDSRVSLTFGGGTISLDLPAGFTLNTQSFSLYVVARSRNVSADTESILIAGASNDMNLYQAAKTGGANVGVFAAGTNTTTVSVPHGIVTYFARGGAANSLIGLCGEPQTKTVFPSANPTGGRICLWSDDSSFPFVGEIYHIALYSGQKTGSAHTDILDYFEATYQAASRGLETFIVTEGDSLTEESNVSPMNDTSWPFRLSTETDLAFAPMLLNVATGGAVLTDMVNETYGPGEITLRSAYTNRVAIIFAGTNDISAGRTAVQVKADLDTLVGNYVSAGATKVYACTITPRGDFNAGQNIILAAVNAYIRVGLAVNGVIDLAADSRLSNPANTTYYQVDTLHHTAAGVTVKVELAKAKLIADGVLELDVQPLVVSVEASPDTSTPTVGQIVTITGATLTGGVEPYVCAISIISAAAGSSATVTNTSGPNTTFVPDKPGIYVIRFTYTDALLSVVTSSVTLTASVATLPVVRSAPYQALVPPGKWAKRAR